MIDPSVPKTDALPGCATPRTAKALRRGADNSASGDASNGKEGNETEPAGAQSPEIVPNILIGIIFAAIAIVFTAVAVSLFGVAWS